MSENSRENHQETGDWTCSHKSGIDKRPFLPLTQDAARKEGVSLDEYVRDNGIIDRDTCLATGRYCPFAFKACDAKINLSQIEKESQKIYAAEMEYRPNVARAFVKDLMRRVKSLVDLADTRYLSSAAVSQDLVGLPTVLVAELSERKGEIEWWCLSYSDGLVVLEMAPKNDYGLVRKTLFRLGQHHIEAVLNDV